MRLPFGAVPAAGKKASASAAFRVVRFPVQPVKIDGQMKNGLKILQGIAGDLLDFSQPVRQGVPVNVQLLHRGGGFSQMLDVDAKRGQKVCAVFPVIGGEGRNGRVKKVGLRRVLHPVKQKGEQGKPGEGKHGSVRQLAGPAQPQRSPCLPDRKRRR